MTSPPSGQPGGVSSCPKTEKVAVSTLRIRPDFLRAAQGRKAPAAGFVLQARRRGEGEPSPTPIRVGFTASRKVGNAVARNRAKRRMRAAAAQILPTHGQPGWDYVLIARAERTASLPFDRLTTDLTRALAQIHTP